MIRTQLIYSRHKTRSYFTDSHIVKGPYDYPKKSNSLINNLVNTHKLEQI